MCASLKDLNKWIRNDDGLEVFKLHGVGGMVGSFLTGIFATASISSLDGATLASGGIDGNGIQVGKQFAEIAAISSYSFLVSCALLYGLKWIPGMHLRVSEEAETIGLDLDQFFDEQIGERDWNLYSTAHDGLSRPGILNATSTPPSEQTESGESDLARKEAEVGIGEAGMDRKIAVV